VITAFFLECGGLTPLLQTHWEPTTFPSVPRRPYGKTDFATLEKLRLDLTFRDSKFRYCDTLQSGVEPPHSKNG